MSQNLMIPNFAKNGVAEILCDSKDISLMARFCSTLILDTRQIVGWPKIWHNI